MSEPYIVYEPEYVPNGFGLHNTGVICWCNSLIQALLSCPSLNRVLLENEHNLADNPFASEYIRLLRAIVPRDDEPPVGDFGAASSNILRQFIRAMQAQQRTFRIGGGQECVDEAFTIFLELFNCSRVDALFRNVYEYTIECDKCKQQVSKQRDPGVRIQMFSKFEFKSCIEFCNWIKNHPSIGDKYTCDCGNVMTNFHRLEKLRMLREIVVIIFNKFFDKDMRWFPDTLEFSALPPGNKIRYKLVAQIEHAGNMHGGHYYTVARRYDSDSTNESMFKLFNDAFVSDSEYQPTTGTYMIIYHMINNHDDFK